MNTLTIRLIAPLLCWGLLVVAPTAMRPSSPPGDKNWGDHQTKKGKPSEKNYNFTVKPSPSPSPTKAKVARKKKAADNSSEKSNADTVKESQERAAKDKAQKDQKNVRALKARAQAIKNHIQALHQEISNIYSKRHDVIYDKRKSQNERNQESKELSDRAKALERELKKADESYDQVMSSTTILN